jgi:hypothetical protein
MKESYVKGLSEHEVTSSTAEIVRARPKHWRRPELVVYFLVSAYSDWNRENVTSRNLQFSEPLAKSMSSSRERGDKSHFPTTIVMLVLGSIDELETQAAFCKRLFGSEISDPWAADCASLGRCSGRSLRVNVGWGRGPGGSSAATPGWHFGPDFPRGVTTRSPAFRWAFVENQRK